MLPKRALYTDGDGVSGARLMSLKERRPCRPSKERKASKSSSLDLLIVRPRRRRCASWKVSSSTTGTKALGLHIQSDSGTRTVAVPSFLDVRPKTLHPMYFGCERIL